MGKKEINVIFETITPLWTGDAWQESKEIRPSSLVGSLRFWFEVICYFGGVDKEEDFDASKGRLEREIDQEELKKKLIIVGCGFEELSNALKELGLHIPDIIFGTTGWRSLIEIKEVDFDKNEFITNPKGKIIQGGNWYWGSPSYQGSFSVKFLVEEKVIDSIFYPLLNFMDKYGYWGGKCNIGYGRLKIKEVKQNNDTKDYWRKEEFNFELFNKNNIKIKDLLTKISLNDDNLFNDLTISDDKKIKISPVQIQNLDLKEVIKELIKIKVRERGRNKINGGDTEERHKIFGTTKKPPNNKDLLPQGSKILPYIKEENGNYIGRFLSIAGLLNIYRSDQNG